MRYSPVIAVLIGGLLSLSVGNEAVAGQRGGNPKAGAKPEVELYSVVEVGDEVKVVRKSEVAQLRREADSAYKDAVKAWVLAKKEAAKQKQKFTEKRPAKPLFKVHASAIKSEAQAEALREKVLSRKKRGDKGGKGERYSIIRVDGILKVISKTELTSFRKGLAKKHREELKAYESAKRAAAKNKEKFVDPKPLMPKVRVMLSGIKSEADAKVRLAKLIEKEEKAKQKALERAKKAGAKKAGKKQQPRPDDPKSDKKKDGEDEGADREEDEVEEKEDLR